MDRLLIPLRSNAAYFATADSQGELEAGIKAAAIFHDELVFQDGRYMVNVWEDGTMDWLMQPNTFKDPAARSGIRYRQPGGEAGLHVQGPDGTWLPIFRGKRSKA